MQFIEIPEFPTLRGEQAIRVLNDFISDLEKRRGKDFTDKQTTALFEFARGLISSLKADAQWGTSDTNTS